MSKHPYRVRSRLLHWAAAALVLVTVISSGQFGAESADQSASQLATHLSFGLTLLLLMVVRVWWRTRTLDPLDAYTLPTPQKVIARGLHFTLYVLLIAQCLLGLALSTLGEGGSFFGVITLPSIDFAADPPGWISEGHEALSNLLLILIGLHILAAVGHLLFGVLPENEVSR
ncbi:MAG: cytochrome b/b6 domain-containing protein [Pseudomonadota bacterium]